VDVKYDMIFVYHQQIGFLDIQTSFSMLAFFLFIIMGYGLHKMIVSMSIFVLSNLSSFPF
jgi:hypothetical protein